MSFTGTPASACLRIETIWVSVNFDFFMEPPGLGNMPERSTSAVSTDQGSLRGKLTSGRQRAPHAAALLKDGAFRYHLRSAVAATPRLGPMRLARPCPAWASMA